MKLWDLRTGGGIAKGTIGNEDARGNFYPQGKVNCCIAGGADGTNHLGRQYYAHVSPSKTFTQGRYTDFLDNYAVGDRILMTNIRAGDMLTDIGVENAHALDGFQFKIEIHDAYELEKDNTAPALFTLPNVDGAKASLTWEQVNEGKPVFGQKFGTVTNDGKDSSCQKHLAIVLVVEALPTTTKVKTSGCKKCQRDVDSCGGSKSFLHAINVSVSVPVHVHEGLRLV